MSAPRAPGGGRRALPPEEKKSRAAINADYRVREQKKGPAYNLGEAARKLAAAQKVSVKPQSDLICIYPNTLIFFIQL